MRNEYVNSYQTKLVCPLLIMSNYDCIKTKKEKKEGGRGELST